jgi:hypothetical protein
LNEVRPALRSPSEVKKQVENDQTDLVKRSHRRIVLIYFLLATPCA